MIKVDCNLTYERIKIKRSLDFGIQGLLWKNVFVISWLFACFLFLNSKTKIKLTEHGK